jgi:hypothetical protein
MSLTLRKHLFLGCIILLMLCSRCQSGKKNDDTDQALAIDTTGDLKTILSKENSLVMANKLEDAIACISANLHRFRGSEKAVLLNERGGAYCLKDDQFNAVGDYLAASDLAPDSPSYILNVATTYESMSNTTNAIFFAKKIDTLKTASDSDRIAAKQVIISCERAHQ